MSKNRIGDLDQTISKIKELYIDQDLQAKEVAEILGYSVYTLKTYISKYGLSKRENMPVKRRSF